MDLPAIAATSVTPARIAAPKGQLPSPAAPVALLHHRALVESHLLVPASASQAGILEAFQTPMAVQPASQYLATLGESHPTLHSINQYIDVPPQFALQYLVLGSKQGIMVP
ncbi:unnamed protein product [Ostreobium quekettii]|uniref:Uncharacterized protein n=1 Tax=Ostreobium quekettii TaxID=121088 RepID=A0A8S1J7H0_9CHLO|nr:unnamed protein product [Ostreobium quekettii]